MSFDTGTSTIQAAAAARDALVAHAPSASERSMATIARGALFTEALLAAVKTHVAEFKTVAK